MPREKPPEAEADTWDRPSRSARKREAEGLQRLGEELLTLRPQLLASLELPDNLREALAEARAIRKGPALARARQYVGRLMRDLEDPEALRTALARLRGDVRPHGKMPR